MARNYVALPHDYLKIFDTLTSEEVGRLVLWLLRYSATGEITELTGREAVLQSLLQMKEDQFQARFEEVDAANQERAKKAAAARWGKHDDAPSIPENAPSMLEDAPDANYKDNNKNNNKNKDNRKDSRKDNVPSPSGEKDRPYTPVPLSEMSPEAQRLMEKLAESQRRLAAVRAEAEANYPYTAW